MQLTGKKYPRIYSISTVGITRHNNADLLIHPSRTDFTGESGTGKSLIGADIPQLILTGGKFYKSATSSSDPREYNNLPLKNLNFAYAFMNVEIKEKKFIAIGVMIKRSPKQLFPFIIQGKMGIDAENNTKFKPLSRIIRYKDFYEGDELLTLKNFQKKYDEQQIYLTSYYHNASDYHKLLYVNKILHLDLSEDENLQKQYAHSLQTLSRGEEIATQSNAFKRFLFTEDDTIAKKFKEQSRAIEEDHRRYKEEWEAQNVLARKKSVLNELLKFKNAKIEAYENRLTIETICFNQQLNRQKKQLKEAIKQYFETELEIILVSQRKNEIEFEKVSEELKNLEISFKGEKNKYKKSKASTEDLKKQLDVLDGLLADLEELYKKLGEKKRKIESIETLIQRYQTTEVIKTAFKRQQKILHQKEKLNELIDFLNNNGLKKEFESSKYSKSFKSAIEFYSQRKLQIKTEIERLQKLKDVIKANDSSSFVGWAVKEGVSLNQIQEAVLFHFATYLTKFDEKENYIPDPKDFIEALKKGIKETENTFVINLSGLHYHVNKRSFYIFENPQKLKNEIERIGSNYQAKIDNLVEELETIRNLEKKLFSANYSYSEAHLNAYLNKNGIQSFIEDSNLKVTDEQLNKQIELYEQEQKLPESKKIKTIYVSKAEKYFEKQSLKTTSKEKLENNATLQNNALTSAKEIRARFSKSIRNRKRITTEESTAEANLITWKVSLNLSFRDGEETFENPFKNREKRIQSRITKYKLEKDTEKLTKRYSDLREQKGQISSAIENYISRLPHIEKQAKNKAEDYKRYFKAEFNPDSSLGTVMEETLVDLREKESSTKSVYESKYSDTLGSFSEELEGNPILKSHNYDLNTLILELIPHEIITNKDEPGKSLKTDIENKLAALSQQIRELSKEEARKIYDTVKELKRIVQQQTTYLDTVKAIISKFRLASHNRVSLEWQFSSEYKLEWVDALYRDISETNFTDNLFGEKTKLNAQELLEINFKKYCNTRADVKARDILNPFNYYKASVKIVDPKGEVSPGSSGQTYGMLALLSIAKLSVVEGKSRNAFNNIRPGLRILPVDEVAGLGENFDMLYDIAQRLDYQIFTMTITANDLTFQNRNQIYYEFIKNADENLFEYNEGIQACFSKDNLIEDIETYFYDTASNFKIN